MPEDWERIASIPHPSPLPRYYAIVRNVYWELFDKGATRVEVRALRSIVIVEGFFPNDDVETHKLKVVPLAARTQYPWNLPPWP